jgi:hypothetical protein
MRKLLSLTVVGLVVTALMAATAQQNTKTYTLILSGAV